MGVVLRSIALMLLVGCGASVRPPVVAATPEPAGGEVLATVDSVTVEPVTVEPVTVEPTVEFATVELETVEPAAEPATVEPAIEPAIEPATVEPTGPATVELLATPRSPSELAADHEDEHARAETARQAFERAERGLVELAALHFEATTLDALFEEVDRAFSRAVEVARAFREAGESTGRSFAALVGEGRVWEELTSALLRIDPRPSESSPPGITLLDEHPRPWRPTAPRLDGIPIDLLRRYVGPLSERLECNAVTRYALVGRASRAAATRDASARFALERLSHYHEDRIASCIEATRRGELGLPAEPTLASYVAGEFYAPPLGMTASLPEGAGLPIDPAE